MVLPKVSTATYVDLEDIPSDILPDLCKSILRESFSSLVLVEVFWVQMLFSRSLGVLNADYIMIS